MELSESSCSFIPGLILLLLKSLLNVKTYFAWKSKSCNISSRLNMEWNMICYWRKRHSLDFPNFIYLLVQTSSIKYWLFADWRGLNITYSGVLVVPLCHMFRENALEESYKCANE